MTLYIKGTDIEIAGILETVQGIASLQNIDADGTLIYAGQTDYFYDEQEPVLDDKGQPIWIGEDNVEYRGVEVEDRSDDGTVVAYKGLVFDRDDEIAQIEHNIGRIDAMFAGIEAATKRVAVTDNQKSRLTMTRSFIEQHRQALTYLRAAVAALVAPDETPVLARTFTPDDRVIIAAEAGAFKLFAGDVTVPAEAGNAETIAKWLVAHGVSTWFYSSSMDFATEYGFEEDDQRQAIQAAYASLAKSQ